MMTAVFVSLWTHALASVAFAMLALWQAGRSAQASRGWVLALAFALTSVWALTISVFGPYSLAAIMLESMRNMGWLGFMLVLFLHGHRGPQRRSVIAVYAALCMVTVVAVPVLVSFNAQPGASHVSETLFYSGTALRMIFAVGALLLVHNLYTATSPDGRWGIMMPIVALAGMWMYDLNIYTTTYLTHQLSPMLFAMRGMIMVMLVPLFVLAARRNRMWKLQLSRRLTFQSLSLVAIGFYLICMAIATRAIEAVGGTRAEIGQITVVFGMSVVALVLLPSGRLRAWLKVKIAKHFFRHRYDYREEWLRFTRTLSSPFDSDEPIAERVIRAIADITESPGGALFMPDDTGRLKLTARRNWSGLADEDFGDAAKMSAWLEDTGRVIEFGALRDPREDGYADDGVDAVPGRLVEEQLAWAGVPLIHGERLFGLVVVQSPLVDRALDWEDFDLLKIVGRQAASYLAEAQGQEALSDARRFDEFNRRFAFIMHDIKNLVSQLSLLARNAERHADNPAFRADMIATIRASVDKMNDMLARLSQHHQSRADEPRAMPIKHLVAQILAPKQKLAPVTFGAMDDLDVIVDPARLEQALLHLVQNGLDASSTGGAVAVSIKVMGGMARIEVRDEGCGMTAEFIRTRLFKPFASTKENGFGIGAFEARSLIQAMGGRIEVESQAGKGSCFAILLPLAQMAGGEGDAVMTSDITSGKMVA